MADEAQIDLGDEAADNFRVYDSDPEQPSMGRYEAACHLQRELLGAGGTYDPGFAAGLASQVAAQRKFAVNGQRALLAADLLRANAGLPVAEWSGIATKALAAATIIYPDPEEAE